MANSRPLYRFPARLESLPAVLARLVESAAGAEAAMVLRAQTVVEELFVNSVSHGGRGNGGQVMVAFAARLEGEALVVRYEDLFAPFDPFEGLDAVERQAAQPLERRKVGGLGRLLAARLADEARYARQRGRNRIDLRFVPRPAIVPLVSAPCPAPDR